MATRWSVASRGLQTVGGRRKVKWAAQAARDFERAHVPIGLSKVARLAFGLPPPFLRRFGPSGDIQISEPRRWNWRRPDDTEGGLLVPCTV